MISFYKNFFESSRKLKIEKHCTFIPLIINFLFYLKKKIKVNSRVPFSSTDPYSTTATEK